MLLEKLPDSSEYKKWSARNGDYTELERIAMETFNEIARLHHTTQALGCDPEKWENYEPPRFLSPLERAEYWADIEADEQEAVEAIDTFNAEIGYS